MNAVRGGGRGSVLVGRSVHNQRIERLWVDVGVKVVDQFRSLFTFLEEEGHLSLEPADLFALHVAFRGRIQQALDDFVEYYNHHILSGVGSTPTQLRIQAVAQQLNSPSTGVQGILEAPEAPPSSHNLLKMSPELCILTREEKVAFRRFMAGLPAIDEESLGIDVFLHVREEVRQILARRQ
jgi:hypothetical protein